LPAVWTDRSVVNGVSSIPFSSENTALPGSRYTALDRFVTGPENRLTGVVAESVSQGRCDYNPLVLTGPPASGKSHLARGLMAAWSAKHPCGAALYTTAAEFSQQFARAVHDGEVSLLRSSYRTSKFMVVEDLSALAGKVTTQQELLHTLDALLDGGAQIITTCREPLSRMTSLMSGLRGRLAAGLEVSLALPELAARTVLVEELAGARGVPITKTAARSLAEAIPGSVPELLGSLTLLEASRVDANEPISPMDVECYLLRSQPRAALGLQNLAQLTARHFGIKVSDLKSPSRLRSVVLARGVAMYLGRQSTDKTLVEIGLFFGGRDHSTVLHGCRQIERLLHCDAQTRQAVEALQAQLTSTRQRPRPR
jgi:chromosomal replication initiator protein